MTSDYFVLKHQRARDGAAALCQQADIGTVVQFREPTRSLEQNAKMWPTLQDLADQVPWSVDGTLQKLTKEEWKVIITAGLRKNQRVAAGIEGGFVMLGESTSKMSIAQMREVITYALWFGDSQDVQWSEPDDDAQ